jgi:adenylate cyclase
VFQTADGHPELAEETYRRALDLNPRHPWLMRELGLALLLEGKNDEALRIFEQNPEEWMSHLGQALVLHQLNRHAESRRHLDRLLAGLAPPRSYWAAAAYAWIGERDKSLEMLELCFSDKDIALRYIRYDPLLRSLRSDPRYKALLMKMNLPLD